MAVDFSVGGFRTDDGFVLQTLENHFKVGINHEGELGIGIAHCGISQRNSFWACLFLPLRDLCNIQSACFWMLRCEILGGSSGRSTLFSYHLYCCSQVIDLGS